MWGLASCKAQAGRLPRHAPRRHHLLPILRLAPRYQASAVMRCADALLLLQARIHTGGAPALPVWSIVLPLILLPRHLLRCIPTGPLAPFNRQPFFKQLAHYWT